ncbi:hypothetical protein BDR26DRAFT_896957 [Obelidium mucronatum]|nr:hypothetical protein BDR26DRAFT_896957 [Obelidium mucronatum]
MWQIQANSSVTNLGWKDCKKFGSISAFEVEQVLDVSKATKVFPFNSRVKKTESGRTLGLSLTGRFQGFGWASTDAIVQTEEPRIALIEADVVDGVGCDADDEELRRPEEPEPTLQPTHSAKEEELPEPVAITAAPAPVKKSWADLVKVPESANSTASRVTPFSQQITPSNSFDKFCASYQVSFNSRLIKPRGLLNVGNMCFMNVILQPLLHCPPFYNLIKQLSKQLHIFFFNEFEEEDANSRPTKRSVIDSFEPGYVHTALRSMKNVDSVKGRQEDAEEFLGFLLDGLHEELVLLRKEGKEGNAEGRESPNGTDSKNDASSWVEVGSKKKTTVTRSTEVKETPVINIFGGRTRSVLKALGDKESVTVEPFQSLQLDIATIHGFTSQALGVPVDATKQNFIEHFPPILILHIKRFVFDNVGGTQKLRKHRNNEEWLRIDDDIVDRVDVHQVTREEDDRQPYMLFYAKS